MAGLESTADLIINHGVSLDELVGMAEVFATAFETQGIDDVPMELQVMAGALAARQFGESLLYVSSEYCLPLSRDTGETARLDWTSFLGRHRGIVQTKYPGFDGSPWKSGGLGIRIELLDERLIVDDAEMSKLHGVASMWNEVLIPLNNNLVAIARLPLSPERKF